MKCDVATLKAYISYNHESGELTWKPRSDIDFIGGTYDPERRRKRWNTRFAGKVAGVDNGDGYVCLKLFKENLKAHQVAWALHFGHWPQGHIDHINGNRSDNRISNLRCVSQAENNKNAGIRKDNKSGVSGVRERNGKWEVNIRHGGKQVRVGAFMSLQDAVAARLNAIKEYGYSTGHGEKR